MSDPGSPFWQNAILYGAVLFLIWETFTGWRRGLVRSGLHFGAFVASGILGLIAGRTVAAVVGFVLPGLAFFSGLLAGAVVTLLTLGICLLASALLFKRTSQQPPGPARWLFGFGGAFFGLLTGVFLLWGAISLVRASGAIAQSGPAESPAARALGTLKDSLELGPLGEKITSFDIMPSAAYDNIVRLGQLSKNQDAMLRFLDDPGVQEILAHPRMQALLQDPQVLEAAQDGNYLVLVQNRAVLNAATDPSLQKLVLSLDLEKALDNAFPAKQDSAPPTP
jgi:hypothetical protein